MPEKKKCLKKCYTSRKEAKQELKTINHNHLGTRQLTTVYYCDICSAWHTTSMKKRDSRNLGRHLKNKKR